MPKPVRKRPSADVNLWARQLVDASTAEHESETVPTIDPDALSAYMSALGRKGGKIGGKSRMNAMTDPEKSALALKAATARWSKVRKRKNKKR